MSYEKHTWETGEVITADKLNHLEGGVEASTNCFFDLEELENDQLGVTPNELMDMIRNGARPVMYVISESSLYNMASLVVEGNCSCTFGSYTFVSDDPDSEFVRDRGD